MLAQKVAPEVTVVQAQNIVLAHESVPKEIVLWPQKDVLAQESVPDETVLRSQKTVLAQESVPDETLMCRCWKHTCSGCVSVYLFVLTCPMMGQLAAYTWHSVR